MEKVEYGQRLLPHLIEERALNNHDRPYASIPRTLDVSDGFQDISYRKFANAINRTAKWIQTNFGDPEGIEPIVYMGPPDLRYHILSLAATKSGYIMFFPSPRNATETLAYLFEQAKARKITTNASPASSVLKVIKDQSMHHVMTPELDELLNATPVAHIPITASFEQWRYRPWILLHTSGSTGQPKIVPIKHGLISAVDTYHLSPESNLMQRYGNMRIFIPFPPFHIAGINFSLPIIAWVDGTVVLPPPGVPITADLIHAVHTHGNVEHSILAPSLVADLTRNKKYLDGLGGLKGLTFSGGPLSKEAADLASSKVKLGSSMGATEYGGVPMDNRKDASDFNYFKFNEALAGLEFRESGQPGLFELIFVRKSAYPNHLVQAIFVTFPEIDEYHTKDCFSKHPTKEGLWKYEARLDDVIVLSNGEKINPIAMEGTIASCPAVEGCIVVGQARFQTALLVEPKNFSIPYQAFLETLQPYVEQANRSCPKYARISMDLVIIVPQTRSLSRAPKGTIQRARNNLDFKDKIDELYENFASLERKASRNNVRFDLSSISSTENSLRSYFTKSLETSDFTDSTDLFDVGLDSLQVISLLRAINALRPPHAKLDQMTVYENPTISKLAIALQSEKTQKGYSEFDLDDEFDKQTWMEMERVFQTLRSQSNERPTISRRLRRAFLKSDNPPPIFQADGGTTAWLQVLGSFLINMNNWGLVNSFGVYQAHYQSVLLPAYSASSIAWIGTFQGTLLLVVGVVSGPLFDRGYFRPMLILATFGVALGMMMLSLSTEYYQIMLSQGLLVGISLGLLYIPSVALVPIYFKKHRGLALGLATSGGSVGGVIYPIVFRKVLVEAGFGWGNRAIGFIALATMLVANVLIKPIGARSTGVRELFDLSAFRDVPYVTFLCSSFVVFCGVLVPFILVTTFGGRVTVDEDLTFYCATILNAAQIFGRVIPSTLSDWSREKFVPGPEMLLFAAQIIAGVLAFCWIAIRSAGGYIAWLCFYGFFSGMNVTLAAIVLPYICPSMAVLGTRLGMLYALAGIGFLISGPVALAANKSSGGFLGSQIWTGACCIVGAGFYIITARQARLRRRLFESRKLRA